MAEITICFQVSQDNTRIEATLDDGNQTTALGARNHHHMLLALARARQEDLDNPALGPEAKGWVYSDELCKQLRCKPDQLDIYVFRARKQLTAAGLDNGRAIVERRPYTRQLRLGTDLVSIEPAP